MPLTARLKRIMATVTNSPPPYDPDVDEHVGATAGKKYLIDYDATRRSSRGSISFDETRRPSSEYRLGGRATTSSAMSAGALPRSVSPATISAALSDAGVRGGSISSVGSGSSGSSGGDSNGNEAAGGGTERRGSAAVVNGAIVIARKNGLHARNVRPDGLRCQICKELLTYDSGHKLNPLDNGLFCKICVASSRHTDPSSFRTYSLSPTTSADKPTSSSPTTDRDRRKSSLSSSISNGSAPLTKQTTNLSLADTGPMPDPDILFDLTVVRPFHLGGYFPVKCSKCGDNFEICHDRYAGARCTVCKDPVWDLCGTCLAKADNGAYSQLLRHKELVHPNFGVDAEECADEEEHKENNVVNGIVDLNGSAGGVGYDDGDVDPMDTARMAKQEDTKPEIKVEGEEEGKINKKRVMQWILYQPPGRIIGPAWRVAAMRSSVGSA